MKGMYYHKYERQSDRYGSVCVGNTEACIDIDTLKGKFGQLVVCLTQAYRPDQHVGDWGRGIEGQPREVGTDYVLGWGTIIVEHDDIWGTFLSVKPADDRPVDWMDPQLINDLYLQAVDIYFEEFIPA